MQDIDVELVEEDGEDNMPIDGATISTGKKRTKKFGREMEDVQTPGNS